MKISMLALIAVLCGVFVCNADETNIAKELTFQDIFATRQGDTRAFVLVGGGWFRGIRFGSPSEFISKWLAQHPSATVTPVSRMLMTNTRTKKSSEFVYVWLHDGDASLNVDLVRAGIFLGAAMADMVDNDKGLTELLKNPQLADARAQIEKERTQMPQGRPERLVSEDEYAEPMRRIDAAEAVARKEKLGIWSDAMKADREAQGIR